MFSAYTHTHWWFAIAEIVQKLFLSSILPFFPLNSQCGVGMGAVLLYLIVLLRLQPHVRRVDDRIALLTQAHLLLILLVGAVLQQFAFVRGMHALRANELRAHRLQVPTDSLCCVPGSLEDVVASLVMLVALLALVLLVVLHVFVFFRTKVQ